MNAPTWDGALLGLSARDRRALAVGCCLLAGLLGTAKGWPSYREWAEQGRAEAALLTREAARARQLARTSADTKAVARKRADELAAYEESLVDGRTPAAAAAELGSLVREAADDAGLEIGPVTVGVDSTGAVAARRSRYVLVRASAEATGLVESVTSLLEEIETGAHMLRVRELSLDPSTSGLLPGGSVGADSLGARLRVRIVVEGSARRAAPVRAHLLVQEAR